MTTLLQLRLTFHLQHDDVISGGATSNLPNRAAATSTKSETEITVHDSMSRLPNSLIVEDQIEIFCPTCQAVTATARCCYAMLAGLLAMHSNAAMHHPSYVQARFRSRRRINTTLVGVSQVFLR
jgi:hypothetical protein